MGVAYSICQNTQKVTKCQERRVKVWRVVNDPVTVAPLNRQLVWGRYSDYEQAAGIGVASFPGRLPVARASHT